MNFYNEDEDKKGAPVMPGTASPFKKTSAFGKTPMFARATGSIIDRLKNLSRKDMAFVGIGLSVLVMAPVAEYMMSQPAQDNLLKETFNPRSGPGGVMDPGINGLSTGSPDGSGEVITPLSSRDPMSLILGAQPAAAVMPPPSAPPTTSYRDAMKESGRAAFTEASKAAGAPTVIPRMQSALRGIASFGGDSGGSRTSGTLGGGKIIDGARSASSKAKSRSMVGPVAMAGYKGVASTPNSSSKGAFEKLRAQADKSAGNFSGGSAMTSLDKAAADAANISGAGGLGAGGDSEKTGKTSGSTTKYDHNRSGETLAEAAAKARQAKALEWEFFKKYEFKKQLLTAVFGAISTEVGKFVGSAVGGAINPAAPGAPTIYCWSAITNLASGTPADCAGGVDQAPLSKDKDGKVTYPPGRNCACGISAKPNSGTPGTGGDTGGDTGGNTGGNTGSNPGPMPSNPPADTAKELEAYDAALVQMAEEAVAGDAATAPKKLLGHAKAAAASMAKCADIAKRLAVNIQTKTPEQVGREKQAYSAAISKARIDVTLIRQKYNVFANRLTAEISKLEGGQKIVKDGVETVQMGNVDTLAVLKAIKSDADSYEKSFVAVAEKKLAFHDKAITQYDEQSSDVTTKAGGVATYADERLGKLTEISDGLKAIKEDAITAEDLTKIKGDFLALTGKKAESVVIPPPPATGGTEQPVVTPVKTVEAADETPFLASAIAWRGAEEQKLWGEKKVDDALAKKTEGETWLKLSPYKRLETGKFEDTSFPEGAVAKDIVSMSMRGIVVLPFDMKGSQGYLPEISLGMGLLDTNLTKWKEQLKQAGLDFDSAATTPNNGGNTTPVAVPGLSDVANTATTMDSDMGTQLGEAQGRYNSVVDSKRCTSVACRDHLASANGNLTVMNKYSGEVKAMSAELKPGISAERMGQIKVRLAQIKDEMDRKSPQSEAGRFNTSIGKAAEMARVPAVVNQKPPLPQVVNNINISANANANATAGSNSSAVVKPTTNNNTTNNTTVNNNKPPVVVVPPVIQPAKPVEPSPNLRVPMLDGNSMTMSRAEFFPNTGTALYKGFYRESGSYLLILAKTAYNYQTTCSRSGTTYKISKVEAAPVAFPANEKTGWVMELLIKKFLRISDIQFGRFYNVSDQRSDLIGKTCHQ